jgi:hypothetical protein
MSRLKVVLVTEVDSFNRNGTLPYKYYGQQLWDTVRSIVEQLQYRCESIQLDKLDFQEQESVNKFLGADIVIMVSKINTRQLIIIEHFVCLCFNLFTRMLPIRNVGQHSCIIKAIEKVWIV